MEIELTKGVELIEPNESFKKQIIKYKKDMLEANSSMDGCGTLRTDNFDTWLKKCKDWKLGKNLPKDYCPSTQYILVRKTDNKVIGMLQIRHKLTDFLFNYGGHIGDSIAVDERQKGYGKLILKLGLQKCKQLNINNILIT